MSGTAMREDRHRAGGELHQAERAVLLLPPSAASCLPDDLRGVNVWEVFKSVAALPQGERAELLEHVTRAFADVDGMRDIEYRVVAVRLLVSLLPATLETIINALRRRDRARDFETHFTLFCYLDWVSAMDVPPSLKAAVLTLAAEYLHDASVDTACAAWMAGDMLGDHWSPLADALPVLMDAVLTARFVAGRNAALHGLVQAVERLDSADYWRKAILALLRRVRSSDKSRRVRDFAAWQLHRGDELAP